MKIAQMPFQPSYRGRTRPAATGGGPLSEGLSSLIRASAVITLSRNCDHAGPARAPQRFKLPITIGELIVADGTITPRIVKLVSRD
jgi:hypothetical protein